MEVHISQDEALILLNRGAKEAQNKAAIKRLKELLTIKREAQSILDDDTVNSWGSLNVIPKYTPMQIKTAQENFSNAIKEIDNIIESL